MKTGLIKRGRHRSNNRPRPQHDSNSMDRGYDREGDFEERLDYRPARNRVVLQQNIDKYLNLAREAMSSGDRVQAENYLQHADHFNRLLNEQKEIKQQIDQKRFNAMNTAQNAKESLEENLEKNLGKAEEAIEDNTPTQLKEQEA